MTIGDMITKLETIRIGLQPGGNGLDAIMRGACNGALAEVRTRIHEQGKSADGNLIGQYNKTHELYVNPLNSPVSFTPLGKNETRAKKTTVSNIATRKTSKISIKGNNQERKTRYFTSYDAFKTFIGRNELGSVNLFLTGGLANQFVVVANGNGFGLGWVGNEYYKRAKALELKYGKTIWGLSVEEKKLAVEAAQIEANKYIRNAIS